MIDLRLVARRVFEACAWRSGRGRLMLLPNAFFRVQTEWRRSMGYGDVALTDTMAALVPRNGKTEVRIVVLMRGVPASDIVDETALILRADVAAWLNAYLPGRWRLRVNDSNDVERLAGIAVRSDEDEVLFRLAWSEELVR